MNKPPRHSAVVKAYLKRLGNPYASLQIGNDIEIEENETSGHEMHSYRLLQNPYAKLSSSEQVEEATEASPQRIATSPVKSTGGSLSKAEFRARCRRIFGQYVPALEKGRLRGHHRDFITRNESSSSVRRYRLVRELEKYDLSEVQGLEARFNREREALTEQKLKQIEHLVDGKD